MKSKRDEEKIIEKARRTSVAEGSAYGVMDGFGHRFVSPYALKLGATTNHIGFLSTFPGLISSISEIFSLKLIEKYSRKKIVIMGTLLQALMWLPIIFLGFFYFKGTSTKIIPLLLIIFYTLLVLFGAFGRPAWNSWMRDLTEKKTDSYFGKRNIIVGSVAIISMFIASFILDSFQKALIGFVIIFFIAFIGRLISAYLFGRQYEPKIRFYKGYYFSFKDFVRQMPKRNFGNYVLFASFITFATTIASPFFTVYMLNNLKFGIIVYTLVVLSSSIVSLSFMPFWGRIGDKYGNVKIMKLCGFFIFLVPLLWMLSAFIFDKVSVSLILFLIFVEIISGIVWSGFNLSSSTFAYHAVTRERMALCVAYEGVTASMGAFLGAILGGWLASFESNILGFKPILFVFLLSAILRVLFFCLFINRFKEVREVDKINMKKFIFSLPRQTLTSLGIKRSGFGHTTHET